MTALEQLVSYCEEMSELTGVLISQLRIVTALRISDELMTDLTRKFNECAAY